MFSDETTKFHYSIQILYRSVQPLNHNIYVIVANTEYCFNGGEADLECPDGYLIDINWAVYKYGYYRYNRCSDPNASEKVKALCDGLNSCTFTCDDQLFNDTTCTNKNERLTVCYKCVPGMYN